jgi:uncharacterized protein (TIGR02594 family)
MDPNIRALQTGLAGLGHDPGPIDGVSGPRTRAAALAFGRADVVAQGSDLPVLPWIRELKSVFGLHEVRDRARLSAWLRSDGKTLGDHAKLPWCGDAMETAIKNALEHEPFLGDLGKNPYWALNWKEFGVKWGLGYGVIGVFDRPGPGAHVGVLVGHDNDDLYVLGGNQGDTLSVVRIDKERLVATRWPKTWADVPVSLPRMRVSDIPKSINEF